MKKLSEVLKTLESGKRPKGGVGEYQDGIPSLGGEHIDLAGSISLSNMKYVPIGYFNNAGQGILQDLDILICKDGALTGKTAIFTKEAFPYEKGMINEHVFILRTADKVSQKYLFYFLYSNQGQQLLKLIITGTAQSGLNRENLLNIQIPLPSKNIQEEIIAEIEILEGRSKELTDKLRSLRNKQSEVIDNVNESLVKLQEITLKIGSGSTPRGGESAYIESGVTLIRSQNVYDNEFYKDGLAYIDDEQAKKLNGVTIEPNDILFNITGASVARCCMVDEKYLPARVNQHVSIIRTNEKALPKYIQQILVSAKYKNELLTIADNSSTREAITKAQLEDFKIPLPSLSEQEIIVTQIEAIESKIAELEQEIAAIPQQKELVLKKYL